LQMTMALSPYNASKPNIYLCNPEIYISWYIVFLCDYMSQAPIPQPRLRCDNTCRHANIAQTDFNFDKVSLALHPISSKVYSDCRVGKNTSLVQVLGPEANQEDVYEAAVRPIVEDVMRGYNGTIMAYGQASTSI
jgi:hypothetical protein